MTEIVRGLGGANIQRGLGVGDVRMCESEVGKGSAANVERAAAKAIERSGACV